MNLLSLLHLAISAVYKPLPLSQPEKQLVQALGKRSLFEKKVDENVLFDLVEKVQKDYSARLALTQYLQQCKAEKPQIGKEDRFAARHALTVFAQAGQSFSGFDLKGGQFHGVNLNNAVLDGTDLTGADLSGATLKCAWLRGAKLDGANLDGAQFGELPWIKADYLSGMSLSPDGTRVLGLPWGGLRIDLVQVSQGSQPVTSLTKTDDMEVFTAVAFMSDNKRVVSGDRTGFIRMWDTNSKSQIGSFVLPKLERIVHIASSLDGSEFACGYNDGTILLFDAATMTKKTYPDMKHSEEVKTVSALLYLPDGQLMSGSWNGETCLWKSGSQVAKWSNVSEVEALACSRDGKQIARAADHNIYFGSLDPAIKHASFFLGTSANSIAFCAQPSWLAIGLHSCVQIHDMNTNQPVAKLLGSTAFVSFLAVDPTSRDLLSYDGKLLRMWDLDTIQSQDRSAMARSASIIRCAPNENWIATLDTKGFQLWTKSSGFMTAKVTLGRDVIAMECLKWRLDILAVATNDRRVTFFHGSKDTGIFFEATDRVRCLVFHFSGKRALVACSVHQRLLVEEWAEEQGIKKWAKAHTFSRDVDEGQFETVNAIAYLDEEKIVAIGTSAGNIDFWDIQTEKLVFVAKQPEKMISGLVVASDTKRGFIHSHYSQFIRVFDWNKNKAIEAPALENDSAVTALCMASEELFVGGYRGYVSVWKEQKRIGMFRAHPTEINAMAFAPPRTLITSGAEGSIRAWDITGVGKADNKVPLIWSTNQPLNLTDVSMVGVQGLSAVNATLCKQRGAKIV